MQKPSVPENEVERLAALRATGLLDSDPELAFDDLAKLASQVCQTPISLISLIDADRQWFKAKVGVDAAENPRDISFCGHAICEPDQMLVVSDALEDERFADNPLVTGEPNIRFYAGMPLRNGGHPVGTVCVIDTNPRVMADEQKEALEALARQAAILITARTDKLALQEAIAIRRSLEERLSDQGINLKELLHDTDDIVVSISLSGNIAYLNHAGTTALGLDEEEAIGTPILEVLSADSVRTFAEAQRTVLNDGGPTAFTLNLQSTAGAVIPVSARLSRRLQEGEPAAINGIFRRPQPATARTAATKSICGWCRRIGDGADGWSPLAAHLESHHGIHLTHSLCESCSDQLLCATDLAP